MEWWIVLGWLISLIIAGLVCFKIGHTSGFHDGYFSEKHWRDPFRGDS